MRRCSRALAVLLAVLGLLAGPGEAAKGDRRKKASPANPAVIAGSVFQENGFSVRGARVVIVNAARPKEKKETTTDVQGEFAVRIPAGQATYAVEVSADGFAPGRKSVVISGDERVDLTFRLAPAAR
jgi:hypothetical protein